MHKLIKFKRKMESLGFLDELCRLKPRFQDQIISQIMHVCSFSTIISSSNRKLKCKLHRIRLRLELLPFMYVYAIYLGMCCGLKGMVFKQFP